MYINYQKLLIFLCLLFTGVTHKYYGPVVSCTEAVKIDLDGFKNLYKINDDIYRSEQPDKKGMKNLQKIGIVTILNLRNKVNDRIKAKETELILAHVPINAWKMSYNDILKALQEIDRSEKPILIHCLHGADRTGALIAAYRLVYQNCSKEAAISEFKDKKFGYHEKWFPNILELLESLDVDLLKKDLGLKK